MDTVAVTLCSGSSGNAALISNGTSHILADCGMSLRRLTRELERFNITPRDLSGVVLTHEHTDHVAGLKMLNNLDIPIYSSEGTLRAVTDRHITRRELLNAVPEGEFDIGGIAVTGFRTSHDAADSRGYTFDTGDAKIGVCTDLGEMTDGILTSLSGCDYVILECNHDIHMLNGGSYPLFLRRRILSRFGHLCNEDCAEAAAYLAGNGTARVTLAHMSEENNDPSLALGAVLWALDNRGLTGGAEVDAAPRHHAGTPFLRRGKYAAMA